jgi:hypothetical protein
MNIEELTNRVHLLEDIESINCLKAKYALIYDDKSNIKRLNNLKNLFIEDAVWDGGVLYGRYEGRDEIIKFFEKVIDNSIIIYHYFDSPTIRIINGTAIGSWYMWVVSILEQNNVSWLSGIEYEKYIKMDGKWFIKEIKLKVLFNTKYEKEKITTLKAETY